MTCRRTRRKTCLRRPVRSRSQRLCRLKSRSTSSLITTRTSPETATEARIHPCLEEPWDAWLPYTSSETTIGTIEVETLRLVKDGKPCHEAGRNGAAVLPRDQNGRPDGGRRQPRHQRHQPHDDALRVVQIQGLAATSLELHPRGRMACDLAGELHQHGRATSKRSSRRTHGGRRGLARTSP